MGRPMAKAVVEFLIDIEERRYRDQPGLVNQFVYTDNDENCILGLLLATLCDVLKYLSVLVMLSIIE